MCAEDISKIKEKYEKINWDFIYLKTPDDVLEKFEMLSKQKELWGYRGQAGKLCYFNTLSGKDIFQS